MVGKKRFQGFLEKALFAFISLVLMLSTMASVLVMRRRLGVSVNLNGSSF